MLYDDQYWWKKDDIEFYKKNIKSSTLALELGAGTGRLAYPLQRHGVFYYGLELSKSFFNYSSKKYKNVPRVRFIQGDMVDFNINNKFDTIFIAFNSFNHLLNEKEAAKCLNMIKEHLIKNGKLILDIINPSPLFLCRDKSKSIITMDFRDSENGELVEIHEKCSYDYVTGLCDIEWEYVYQQTSKYNKKLNYKMKMFYPDTINRMLVDCGYKIDKIYGDYRESPFNEDSGSQIIICH